MLLGAMISALAAAKSAWRSADLSSYDEPVLMTRFGAQLTPQDHDDRVDALLFARKFVDAQRLLPWTSAARRPALAARIAMQTRAPDTEARYAAVAAKVTSETCGGSLLALRQRSSQA